jgi:hypothetical protein
MRLQEIALQDAVSGDQSDHSVLLSTGCGIETRIGQNCRQIRRTIRQALLGFQSPNIIPVNLVLAKKRKKAKKAMKKKARKAAKKRVVKRKPAPAPTPAPEPVSTPAPETTPSAPSEGTPSTPSTPTW